MKMPGEETFGNLVVVHTSPARKARYPIASLHRILSSQLSFYRQKDHVSSIKKALIPPLTFRRYLLRIVSVGTVISVFR